MTIRNEGKRTSSHEGDLQSKHGDCHETPDRPQVSLSASPLQLTIGSENWVSLIYISSPSHLPLLRMYPCCQGVGSCHCSCSVRQDNNSRSHCFGHRVPSRPPHRPVLMLAQRNPENLLCPSVSFPPAHVLLLHLCLQHKALLRRKTRGKRYQR